MSADLRPLALTEEYTRILNVLGRAPSLTELGVFSVMFYSIFAHRKSKGHQAARFHENTLVEVVWTMIPFLILMFMAFPATRTVLAMKDAAAPDMTIKVTGYQWKWSYDYLDHGFGFYSNLSTPYAQIHNLEPKGEHYLLEVDNPMVVPVNAKVRLVITANDVIHAWYVPRFLFKRDVVPGQQNHFEFTVDAGEAELIRRIEKKAQTDLLPLFALQEREYYQRSRPPLLFPRSPPPPSRLSIGLASLTVRVRPPSSVPFSAWMAFCASPPELISTKPKPRD